MGVNLQCATCLFTSEQPACHALDSTAADASYGLAPMVQMCLQAPVTSLDMYLDGESTVEQDLVAWLSMGIIHVPRGEVGLLVHACLAINSVSLYIFASGPHKSLQRTPGQPTRPVS